MCSRCKAEHSRAGAYCAPCHAEYYREYRQKNLANSREYDRRRRFKQRYGLEYDEYLEFIKDGCAVCGSKDNLQIDHDHACCDKRESCGKCVRGVLCKKHNVMLGRVRDSVEELQKLIDYLVAFEARRCYT